MTSQTDVVQIALRKLCSLAQLSSEDAAAFARLPVSIEAVPSHRYLTRQGMESARCCILVEGYACRHKVAHNGARQIVSFHMRGDILDLEHLLFDVADCSVQTISNAVIGCVSPRALKQLAIEHPAIGEALWRDTLIDASIFREWVLNIGRRDAKGRIAHLLCEFAARARTAGLASSAGFELPMTQEEIADATGLTTVHVNRTLRSLREEGLISIERRHLTVNDWKRLQEAAGFDPEYLRTETAVAA